ncbi:MAG: IclR family transcriptional regulator [Solirubrobacteraceae bacterium]
MTVQISEHAEPRRSRSVEYGLAILQFFTAERPVLRNSDIASAVGISRATSHRYLSTLVDLGYLEKDANRRYLLARNADRPGIAVVNGVRRETRARAILEDLRATTGHTVSMGLLDGARALYIYRLHGHRAGQYEADGDLGAGAHVPAHDTAVGKALLSTLLDSELRTLLPDMRLDNGEADTAASEAALTDEIERVRRDGIAVSATERGRSIAVPITRWIDKPILAVELTAPAAAYTPDKLVARFAEPLKHSAGLLSA